MMDETKKNLAEGPGSIPQSDYRHGNQGDFVDINSYQPATVAPAALHLSQVPENMRSVGHEPAVAPLSSGPTTEKLVYEPEAGTFVPDGSPSVNSESANSTDNETLLNQVVHKAEGILSDAKGLAGSALSEAKGLAGSALSEAKDLAGTALSEAKDLAGTAFEKASGVWHSVAGTIGAGPGKELAEDQSERVIAGQGDKPISQHGVDLGVDVSSYQPAASGPAGMYPHGEIRISEESGHRSSELVGEKP